MVWAVSLSTNEAHPPWSHCRALEYSAFGVWLGFGKLVGPLTHPVLYLRD